MRLVLRGQIASLFVLALAMGCEGHIRPLDGDMRQQRAASDAGADVDASPGARRAPGGRGGSSGSSGASGSSRSSGASGASGKASDADTDAGSVDTTHPAANREAVYGVTLDTVEPLDDIVDALHRLARKPTARIVFDPIFSPSHYAEAVRRIHSVSWVMGELVDSINVNQLSVDEYAARTTAYLDQLGDDVDIWEIGNEINGEWLGDTADVQAKMLAAFRIVHGRGKQTALTLFYNQSCFSSADHEMFAWAQANVPDEMKRELDYVFISYYEENCRAPTPDWNSVFRRLASLFSHSKVGFGECGTTEAANKAAYLERYYGLVIDASAYVGGYFWWYFRQDMLPYTVPLWAVLNRSIQREP